MSEKPRVRVLDRDGKLWYGSLAGMDPSGVMLADVAPESWSSTSSGQSTPGPGEHMIIPWAFVKRIIEEART